MQLSTGKLAPAAAYLLEGHDVSLHARSVPAEYLPTGQSKQSVVACVAPASAAFPGAQLVGRQGVIGCASLPPGEYLPDGHGAQALVSVLEPSPGLQYVHEAFG
jgi:hypothetical protein